jgi:predicted GH43/DUF377 family glycosyl hydrolase
MAFTKLGVVIPLGASGTFDGSHVYLHSALLRDGKTWMYYDGNPVGSIRIGLAGSDDGVHFTKLGVVLPLGASGAFDDVYIHSPSALVRDGKTWLYYTGYNGSAYRVGLAVSDDGVHFTKLGVVLPLGASGAFDDV